MVVFNSTLSIGILSISTPFDTSNKAHAAVSIDIHFGGAFLMLKVVAIVLFFTFTIISAPYKVQPFDDSARHMEKDTGYSYSSFQGVRLDIGHHIAQYL
jgi:hypothetical protein